MKAFSNLAALMVLSLVVAGCGGDDPEETTTTTTSTTTTVPETTTSTTTSTTTTIPAPASPLNGAPVADETLMDRRVVAIKIDNHPEARPQSGLQEAEAVIELIVEAGLTRFIALFHAVDSEYVGPVRSVRPTDPGLLRPLDATFQFSGGQPWIRSLASAAEVAFLTENSPSTWRIPRNGRAYERTLYASSVMVRDVADEQDYPDEPPVTPWFAFDEPDPGGEEASTVTMSWSGSWPDVIWEWDGTEYLRFNGETPHEWTDGEGNGAQMATDTLMVLTAEQYNACPGAGQGGSCVPAEITTGEGPATLFHDGVAFEGTWQREEIDDVFTLTTDDGEEMSVPPGRLWVSVFPANREVTWE